MPGKKRFLVFLGFIVVFIFLIPIILLYSAGYRLGQNFAILPTGGAYVFYPESGASVYLDGALADRTSLFERGVFIDDLDPKVYHLEVKKEGYLPWKKDIEVLEKKVAEAYPFLIPQVISTSTVPSFVQIASGASVTNPLYTEVSRLFASSTPSSVVIPKTALRATTSAIVATTTGVIRKDIEIDLIGKKIVASWKGSVDSTPFYFCDADRTFCDKELVVTEGDIKRVDFYPGRNDVVLYSTKEGLFVTELDKRSPQNTFKLVSGNLEFRQKDQRVYVKQGKDFYEIIFTASTTLNSISI